MNDDVSALVPGDKSVGIRAMLLALVAAGPSTLRGIADSRITSTTIEALRTLGGVVDVTLHPQRGLFAGGLDLTITPPTAIAVATTIDCGGSATLARLLSGLLAGRNIAATLVGSEMLSRRPMTRVAAPLARFFGREVLRLSDGHLPAQIIVGPLPHGDDVIRPGDSAQVRSAVMLAAIGAKQSVTLWSARPGRRHTEQLLRRLGVDVVDSDPDTDGRLRQTVVPAVAALPPIGLSVPGDPSAAAFFEALAALTRRRPIVVAGVIDDDERNGLRRVLLRMRADDGLCGVVVAAAEISDLVDEIPILAAVCAGASTPSTLHGLAELRVKESDRLARIIDLLAAFGVVAEAVGDDLMITPGPWTAPTAPIVTDHDHRIGMTALVMAAVLNVVVELDDPGCVDESWRGFAGADGQLAAVTRALRQQTTPIVATIEATRVTSTLSDRG